MRRRVSLGPLTIEVVEARLMSAGAALTPDSYVPVPPAPAALIVAPAADDPLPDPQADPGTYPGTPPPPTSGPAGPGTI